MGIACAIYKSGQVFLGVVEMNSHFWCGGEQVKKMLYWLPYGNTSKLDFNLLCT